MIINKKDKLFSVMSKNFYTNIPFLLFSLLSLKCFHLVFFEKSNQVTCNLFVAY